jgi:hypothetical protein
LQKLAVVRAKKRSTQYLPLISGYNPNRKTTKISWTQHLHSGRKKSLQLRTDGQGPISKA